MLHVLHVGYASLLFSFSYGCCDNDVLVDGEVIFGKGGYCSERGILVKIAIFWVAEVRNQTRSCKRGRMDSLVLGSRLDCAVGKQEARKRAEGAFD